MEEKKEQCGVKKDGFGKLGSGQAIDGLLGQWFSSGLVSRTLYTLKSYLKLQRAFVYLCIISMNNFIN